MNNLSFFPRPISNLVELTGIWLRGENYVTGTIKPLSNFNNFTSLGSLDTPFSEVHANYIYNSFGQIKINDLTSSVPIVTHLSDGVADIHLSIDGTLQITPDGKLSVVPKILMQSDLEMKATAPIKLILDSDVTPGDPIGSNIVLDYDNDDLSINEEGKLKTILPTWKGMGALKVGGVTDVDFLDNFYDGLSDDDLNIPKLKAIRLQTSSDFTQVSGQLSIAPKGLGQIPYYSLDGLSADEGLYYNSVSNTLSTNRILLTTNFVLLPNDVPTKAYLSQYIQSAVGLSGIDVLPEIAGTNRRELRVRTDPTGAVMLDPSAGGALDVRCDSVTIVKKAGMLSANYMGDED